MPNTANTAKHHNLVRRVDPATGSAEVGVLLSNRKLRVWTSAEAYDRIVEQHGPRPWYLNDNGKGQAYVRLASYGRGAPVMVCRLVLGVPPRKVIKYHDGDRLNLRPGNLVMVGRKGCTSSNVAAAQRRPAQHRAAA